MNIKTTVPHPATINKHNFNCPHCGAHSDQTWFKLAADPIPNKNTPLVPGEKLIEIIQSDKEMGSKLQNKLLKLADRINDKLVFLEDVKGGVYLYNNIYNLNLSKCYSCKKISVWVHDELLFPQKEYIIPPNKDLPQDILNDYEEASSILAKSPRGAAALLRLAIQKLCMHLGQPGKHLNSDIAALVKEGLNTQVKEALDIVRVIGNNAVHPGQIDLQDNDETAKSLFGLVNIISEKMITEPKHVKSMFDNLPDNAKNQIKKRDEK
ncbi:MAG: DUF4145 domain-containing protein [Chlorobi bacterium]|nr:DUF4145 domain-containing protein [Chlorobiota bacterium]